MKLKKQQMVIVGVILIALILVVSLVVILNPGTGNGSNNGLPNGDGTNGDGSSGDTNGDGDGDGDNDNGDGDSSQTSGSWVDLSSNIEFEDGVYIGLSDVYFVSDLEGWITSSSHAEIYHTTDGGETFEIQTTQLPTEAIYMLNENEGYAGGASGFIYRTTDGGTNWDFHGTMVATLADIDFASPTQGYACGDHGAVFSITPDGVTNLNSGLSTDLGGISSPSVGNVWVCGGNKIVYYDGATFDFQSGPVGTFNSIFFINNQEGWVVGDSGLIGHTTDGGNGWDSQINPDPNKNSLYDVFFLNANEGWAVGGNGAILHTTNSGITWTVEAEGQTNNFLRGISAPAANCVYICGNEGTFLKYVGE